MNILDVRVSTQIIVIFWRGHLNDRWNIVCKDIVQQHASHDITDYTQYSVDASQAPIIDPTKSMTLRHFGNLVVAQDWDDTTLERSF